MNVSACPSLPRQQLRRRKQKNSSRYNYPNLDPEFIKNLNHKGIKNLNPKSHVVFSRVTTLHALNTKPQTLDSTTPHTTRRFSWAGVE